METTEHARLERIFLEARVAANKAETALRCYFITHPSGAGVSDLDEYEALRKDEQHAADAQHRAYRALVDRVAEPTSSNG